MRLADDKHVYVDGQFVSQKVSQVVEAIKEYEPELEVRFIPEAARTDGEAAYAIVHCPVGSPEYVLFYVQRDEDMDERVLHRIIFNDQRHGKTQLSELEAWEQSQKLVQRQKALDELEEAHDMAKFVLKTPLNKIRMDNGLVIRDYGGGRLS